ncbi:MAG TPA: hypothetical protein VF793_22245, partial [Telluria sp.]
GARLDGVRLFGQHRDLPWVMTVGVASIVIDLIALKKFMLFHALSETRASTPPRVCFDTDQGHIRNLRYAWLHVNVEEKQWFLSPRRPVHPGPLTK